MKRTISLVLLVLAILVGMLMTRTKLAPPASLGAVAKVAAPALAQAVQPFVQRAIPTIAPRVAKVVAAKLPIPTVAQHLAEPKITQQVEQALNDANTSDRLTRIIESVAQTPTTDVATGFTDDAATSSSAPLNLSPVQQPRRLIVGTNVQGGIVGTMDHATGYIVALQWLKVGRTNDPRNLRFAFASPAFYAAPNVHELGLLPISVNVAELVPHQPFTNIWVSPYVSIYWQTLSPQGAAIKRVGLALTATF
jgi:hypothetical protein